METPHSYGTPTGGLRPGNAHDAADGIADEQRTDPDADTAQIERDRLLDHTWIDIAVSLHRIADALEAPRRRRFRR